MSAAATWGFLALAAASAFAVAGPQLLSDYRRWRNAEHIRPMAG